MIKFAFRITHIENIKDIDRNGVVHQNSSLASPNYVPIGDPSLIRNRCDYVLENGHKIGEYIPFYFGERSPMLYVIQHGFNGVKKILAEDIVYVVVKIADVVERNLECVFTDGHANNKLSKLYEKECLRNVDKYISEEDIHAQQWGTPDTDLKRRKEAELLFAEDLPPELICGYVVYNENAQRRMIELDINPNRIVIRSDFYY